MEIALALLSNRLTQLGLAILVGFGWGWANTSARWRDYMAQQDAARRVLHQMEMAREAQNAVEIAKAATQRAEDDAAELAKLKQQVSDFDKGETHAQNPCLMDDVFVDAARKLRQPAHRDRPAKIARPPK